MFIFFNDMNNITNIIQILILLKDINLFKDMIAIMKSDPKIPYFPMDKNKATNKPIIEPEKG